MTAYSIISGVQWRGWVIETSGGIYDLILEWNV